MVLDPTSGALQAGNRAERPATTNVANEQDRVQEERPEAGQTSESGDAVVTNISAAALETTRPVNPPEQTADDNRANDAVENKDRGQSQVREQEQERVSQRERSEVDVVV